MGLITLAIAGAALYLFSSKKTSRAAQSDPETSWDVRNAGNDGSAVFFDVFAPQGAFGPHGELYVLRFSRTGTGAPKYVSHEPSTPKEIISAAVRDFDIKGAATATRG